MADNNTNKLTILFEGDSKKLEAAVNAANKAMDNFDKKVKNTAGNKSGGMGNLNKKMDEFKRLAVGAFAAQRVYDFAKATIQLGAKVDGISRSFNEMAISSGVSLSSLREATKGAVSDIDLMQQAVQARNFKIPLQGLAELFEFAAIRAQQTGESVEYLTRSIVLGIGRKSPLILDNLGITLVRLKEAMGKVGRESATVQDIFEATVKIAKEETQVMKMLGDDSLTAANKLDALSASFKNLQVSMGSGIVKSNLWEQFTDWITGETNEGQLRDAIEASMKDADIKERVDPMMFKSGMSSLVPLNLRDAEELVLISEMIQKARANIRKEAGEQAIEILPEGAVDAAAKDSAILKKYVEELLENPISKYGKEQARAFATMVKEREAELSAMIAKEKKHAEEITKIKDRFAKALIINAEAYRQEGDIVSKLKSDVAAYKNVLKQLTLQGEQGSEAFKELDTNLRLLQETLKKETSIQNAKVALEEITAELALAGDEAAFAANQAILYKQALAKIFEVKAKAAAQVHDFDGTAYPDSMEGMDEEDAGNTSLKNINKDMEKYLESLQKAATMWGIISQAIGGIADGLNGDSGVSKAIGTFAKLAQTAAATAAAVAAVQSALDPSAPARMIAAAVGVATALGGVLSAVGGISTGSAGKGSNLGSLGGATMYTEISGRNLRIVMDRDGAFSKRRG